MGCILWVQPPNQWDSACNLPLRAQCMPNMSLELWCKENNTPLLHNNLRRIHKFKRFFPTMKPLTLLIIRFDRSIDLCYGSSSPVSQVWTHVDLFCKRAPGGQVRHSLMVLPVQVAQDSWQERHCPGPTPSAAPPDPAKSKYVPGKSL